MKCQDIQSDLTLFLDEQLPDDQRLNVLSHIGVCPHCREMLDDLASIKRDLRATERPSVPAELLVSVRTRVAEELRQPGTEKSAFFDENFRRWLQMRFMPYTVGTVTSFVLGFMLLWTLLAGMHGIGPAAGSSLAARETDTEFVLLANADPKGERNEFELSARDFAAARISVSGESPSVNPHGALIALTKSLVRGRMKDDEVVVVADVFGNGLARISEVVEPSRDRLAVYELEKALKTDPAFAPFVPAEFDRRSESVRVVLRIQSVNVRTGTESQTSGR